MFAVTKKNQFAIIAGRSLVSVCMLTLVTAFCGCGKAKEPWERVQPARGVVKFKGKPVKGALIRLIPTDEKIPDSVRPQAKSNADGTFVLETYGTQDGAPIGNYRAVVVHNEVVISEKGGISTKPNSLPKRYSNMGTTDLVVEIAQGVSELPPLELK